MNNKPIVPGRVVFAFILERYNLKSAEKYGKVAFAIESKNPPSPFQGSELAESMDRGLRKLAFNPQSDWIALCGPLFHIATMVSIISARGTNYIKFLIFDAKYERYVERRILLTNINIEREKDLLLHSAIAQPASPELNISIPNETLTT